MEQVASLVAIDQESALNHSICLKVGIPKELYHTLEQLAQAEECSLADFLVGAAIERLENVQDYQVAAEYKANQDHGERVDAKTFFESLGYDYV